MKHANHRLFSAASVIALAVCTSVHAADINQVASAASGQSWNTAALWDTNSAASAGNHYFTNGYGLRTPDQPSGSQTFPGASLTVDGGTGGARGSLTLKAGTVSFGHLKVGAGTVANVVAGAGGNLPATLNVTNFEVLSTATSASTATIQGNNTGHDLTLGITNLLGEGYLRLTNPRAYSLSVDNGSAFTGTLNLNQGTLTLASALTIQNADFTMSSSGASLVLSNDLRVSSLIFGTLEAESGIYTSSDLNALFSTTAFSGDGSLHVAAIPEPSSVALGAGALTFALVGLRRRSR